MTAPSSGFIGLQLFMQLAADDAAEEQAETYREARRMVSTALVDLRDLAHGIHPAARSATS